MRNGILAFVGMAIVAITRVATADTLIGVLPTTLGGTSYQAYYDPATNLTWLANANVIGPTNWSQANAWATSLNINGITGWTLPTISPSCVNCTSNELGNLFYGVLGGQFDVSIDTTHNNNYNLFSNIWHGAYWSSTGYTRIPGINTLPGPYAWGFCFCNGYQAGTPMSDTGVYSWAVHSGNVSVPEPSSPSLMLAGLALLGFAVQRRLALRS